MRTPLCYGRSSEIDNIRPASSTATTNEEFAPVKGTDSLRSREIIGDVQKAGFGPSTDLTRRSTTRSSEPPNHPASPPRGRGRYPDHYFTDSYGRGSATGTRSRGGPERETGSEKPETGNEKPGTRSEKPRTRSEKPGTTNQER